MLKEAGCDMIDCSTGQTVPHQRPVYGRMYQAPFADWVRNEVGIATMTVGAVTTPDQVNTLLAAGKADLVALARPHLANPYFTLQARPGTSTWASTGRRNISPGATRRSATRRASAPSRRTCASRRGPTATR